MTLLVPKTAFVLGSFLICKTAASHSSWRKENSPPFLAGNRPGYLVRHRLIERSTIIWCVLFCSDTFRWSSLSSPYTCPLTTGVEDIVAIMIPEPKGKEIVSLLERNITVTMYITIGTRNLQKYVSRTSVVFVSISFIVLMIISLAWLVFYYIQRFRYANARDRNQVSSRKLYKKKKKKLKNYYQSKTWLCKLWRSQKMPWPKPNLPYNAPTQDQHC